MKPKTVNTGIKWIGRAVIGFLAWLGWESLGEKCDKATEENRYALTREDADTVAKAATTVANVATAVGRGMANDNSEPLKIGQKALK